MGEKYRKLSLLGKGATAMVYLVERGENGKKYAMKCGENGVLLEAEAKLLQELQYSAFPRLEEYKSEEYIVMEYIEGNNLQELLDSGKLFSMEEIVYIMDGILQAIHYLHLQKPQIIYRDLKPGNIIIDKSGKVRVIDLGAACYCGKEVAKRQENCTLRAGTYGYAAPEQFWSGAIADKSCDIYAAGKIFAYLLSGKNPAEPPYDMEHFCKGLKNVSGVFLEIIKRSLIVEPEARYEDCESMRRAIHRAYEETITKKIFKFHKNRAYTYKKCIWKSEYRRIF